MPWLTIMLDKVVLALNTTRDATKVSSLPVWRQLQDLIRLRFFSPGQIGFFEYYDYGLFNHTQFDQAQRESFMGWRSISRIQDKLNASEAGILAEDKLIFYCLMHAVELPVPETMAAYIPTAPPVPSVTQTLTNRDELSAYLTTAAVLPLFAKPVRGIYGSGAYLLEGYDPDTGMLHVGDRGPVALEELLDEIETHFRGRKRRGYLLQRVVQPHPDLADLAGERLSGLRVAMVERDGEPRIYCAVLKINSGRSITDNFEHGKSGNLLADVDIETGIVSAAFQGAGENLCTVEHHPLTGKAIKGFQVPHWQQVMALCRQVMLAIPGMRMAGLDIAVTPTGPVVLEINNVGDFDLLQIASGRGVLEDSNVRYVLTESKVIRG